MGEQEFQKDIRALKLGSSDMILGIDWLRQYNPIAFDSVSLAISFVKDGQQVSLPGGKKEFS